MTKIRVHEYAKQVNRSSKEVIDELGKINVNVANHMSTIDKEAVQSLIVNLVAIKTINKHQK